MADVRIATGMSLAPIPPIGLIRAQVAFARLSGFASLLLPDHLQMWIPGTLWDREFSWAARRPGSLHRFYDVPVLLGTLAGLAGPVRLGAGVTPASARHPVHVAQAMVTVSHLAKRPPILGIGAGERENVEPYGLDFSHPAGRLEEALQILRRCFAGQEPIDFDGRYFHLEQAVFRLRAPAGRVPEIWISGEGPRMLRLVGQYGDGWYPGVVGSTDEYAAKLATIRAHAIEAGRDPAAITPALYAWLLVGRTEREARAMLESKALRYAVLLLPAEAWRAHGVAHPFGEQFRGYVDLLPERFDRETLELAIAAVPPGLGAQYVLCGTTEQVLAKIRAFGQAGLRHVVLDPLWMTLHSPAGMLKGLLAIHAIGHGLRTRAGPAVLPEAARGRPGWQRAPTGVN